MTFKIVKNKHMKNSKLSITLIIILISNSLISAQSEIKAAHAVWKADSRTVSLKRGHKPGIKRPKELTLKVFFENELTEKYSDNDLKFEFKWFHYYATKKAFMDSYVVNYDKEKKVNEKSFYLSSSRRNITPGWWEVQVIARYDGKPVQLGNIKKFQIFVQ